MSATEIPAVREPGFWDGAARSYIPPDPLPLPPSLAFHDRAAEEVDPVTFEVVRYALMHANFEHSALLQRLCVSPITMLTRDFQTSLLTELGDLVFLGPNLQYFSNSHSLSIKYALQHRVEALGVAPGDMFISNDAYVGAPHQPDTALLAPVFVDDELFCWVANTLHYSDVGGSTPGSFCIDALDTFQEPLNWPPVKLVEAGTVRPDIFDLFIRQSRLPAAVAMDLHAAIGGNQTTTARVLGLVERYGAEVVKAVMLGTMDAAEALFAERLRSIPDGSWSHRALTEASVPGDREVYAYQINLTKDGERLIVDNRGTDPQAGSINVTYAAFSGAVLAAITQSMASDLAGAYGGVYRRVEFRPEPGLLNCCDFPGAVSPSGAMTTEMQLNVAVIAVAKMLACGDESARALILGPNVPHFYGTIQGGLTPQMAPWIFPNTDGMMGALGGMPDRDGVDVGGHFWIPEGLANNVEDVEAQFPLVVLWRRLLEAGADGAGRQRGGVGFVEATMPRGAPYFQMAVASNDSFPKGGGLFGANPGSMSPLIVKRGTDVLERMGAGSVPQTIDEVAGELHPVAPKIVPFDLGDGDVWEWVSPSVGGFGDPLRRDPAAVLADVEARVLGADAAERVYGVVLAGGGVDEDATRARRRALLAERLAGEEPGEEVAAPAGARRVGDLLFVVDGRWWCNGAGLGPAEANYKDAARVRELPFSALAPEFAAPEFAADIAEKVVFREFLCPVTGLRIDTEIARAGEPFLHDIALR